MTFKIMISVSDEIKEMINEYNRTHQFKRYHPSEICQQALFDDLSNVLPKREPTKKNSVATLQQFEKQPITENLDKPTISCPICGKEFVKTKSTQMYCCKNCGTQASRLRKKSQEK